MQTSFHADPVEEFRPSHFFLGDTHDRNERKTWFVIALCSAMMLAEILGGIWFGSVALIADGLHMSTHTGALLIAALAYTYARRHAADLRFSFSTGKFGDLAAFTSATVLAMVALLIAYEFDHPAVQPGPDLVQRGDPDRVSGPRGQSRERLPPARRSPPSSSRAR